MADPTEQKTNHKAVQHPDWEEIAKRLWGLLDNIDTASDVFKDNYIDLATYIYEQQQYRHLVMTSDGCDLFPLLAQKEMQQLLFPEHAWHCGIFMRAGDGECDCGQPMETDVKYDDQRIDIL